MLFDVSVSGIILLSNACNAWGDKSRTGKQAPNAEAKRKRISRVHVQFHVKEIYLRRLNEVSLEP